MTPIEYLDAAKAVMGITSDYELAKRLETNGGNISEVRQGKRGISVELAFRLAITLELDPASVVADLESQQAKESKREFWRSFLSRAAMTVAVVCTLGLSSFATYENGAALLGGVVVASATYFMRRFAAHNLYYVKFVQKIMRLARAFLTGKSGDTNKPPGLGYFQGTN